MNRKINTYRSLLHLVRLDETDHILKDIAQLFLSALTDWPTDTHHDIVKCIQEFKDYFGDPFTFVDGRIINIVSAPDWSWRGESGAALTKMIELSIKHFDTTDFDAIVDRVLSHYEQKFLLTSKQKPLKSTGFAHFTLSSNTLTETDYKQWLGVEPDVFISTDNTGFEDTKTTIWGISTKMAPNTVSSILIRQIVNRLTPIKDRVIALKQAHPDLDCELELVYWSNPLDSFLYMDNETMSLLGEIGAQFHTEMFPI